jgi:hypothetical protein
MQVGRQPSAIAFFVNDPDELAHLLVATGCVAGNGTTPSAWIRATTQPRGDGGESGSANPESGQSRPRRSRAKQRRCRPSIGSHVTRTEYFAIGSEDGSSESEQPATPQRKGVGRYSKEASTPPKGRSGMVHLLRRGGSHKGQLPTEGDDMRELPDDRTRQGNLQETNPLHILPRPADHCGEGCGRREVQQVQGCDHPPTQQGPEGNCGAEIGWQRRFATQSGVQTRAQSREDVGTERHSVEASASGEGREPTPMPNDVQGVPRQIVEQAAGTRVAEALARPEARVDSQGPPVRRLPARRGRRDGGSRWASDESESWPKAEEEEEAEEAQACQQRPPVVRGGKQPNRVVHEVQPTVPRGGSIAHGRGRSTVLQAVRPRPNQARPGRLGRSAGSGESEGATPSCREQQQQSRPVLRDPPPGGGTPGGPNVQGYHKKVNVDMGTADSPKAGDIEVAELPRPPEWPLGAHVGPRTAAGKEPIAQSTLPRPPDEADVLEEVQAEMRTHGEDSVEATRKAGEAGAVLSLEQVLLIGGTIVNCAIDRPLPEERGLSAEGA